MSAEVNDSLTENRRKRSKHVAILDSSTVQDGYKGDLVSNWEFFRDSWKNYATATKLADKDKKIIAAKECLHVCRNLPMTAEERQDADVILTKLSE